MGQYKLKKKTGRIEIVGTEWLSFEHAHELWNKDHYGMPYVRYEYEHPGKRTTIIADQEQSPWVKKKITTESI